MCRLFAPHYTRRSIATVPAITIGTGSCLQHYCWLQAMQHLMQRSLSAAFNSWRLVAQEMRQHGHNLVLAVTRWQHSYMSSAFYTWLDWVQERRSRYASLVSLSSAGFDVLYSCHLLAAQLAALPLACHAINHATNTQWVAVRPLSVPKRIHKMFSASSSLEPLSSADCAECAFQ